MAYNVTIIRIILVVLGYTLRSARERRSRCFNMVGAGSNVIGHAPGLVLPFCLREPTLLRLCFYHLLSCIGRLIDRGRRSTGQ